MCPLATGQIHTSSHAGGMTRERIRSSVAGSSTFRPPASTYSKPFPRRRRARPGAEQETRRSLAMTGSSDLGFDVHGGLLGRVAAEVGADVPRDEVGLVVGARTLVRLDQPADALAGPLVEGRVASDRLVRRD